MTLNRWLGRRGLSPCRFTMRVARSYASLALLAWLTQCAPAGDAGRPEAGSAASASAGATGAQSSGMSTESATGAPTTDSSSDTAAATGADAADAGSSPIPEPGDSAAAATEATTPAEAGDDGASGDAAITATGGAGFYPQDIAFTSTANKANPYMDVGDFKVTFKGPNGIVLTLPGFYTGNQVWKVRFSTATGRGTFTYSTSSTQDPSLNGLTGTVPAAPPNPTSHGAIRVDPALPHHYLYADGTRYFQMGYELDWLGLLDFGDPNIAKAKTLIDMVAANGFTEVLMQAYAYDTAWKPGMTSAYDFGPPTQFPWAGTNAAADNTRMNETFWQSYDRVIAYLFEKGITAHIFFKYVRTYGANMLVSWPAHNSPEEDMYFRFLIARYAAYPNVIWDMMKESYHETDQVYLANRLAFIRANDPYQHLRTIHDSDGGQGQFSPNYYDVPSHAGTFELYTDQQTNQYATAAAAWKKRVAAVHERRSHSLSDRQRRDVRVQGKSRRRTYFAPTWKSSWGAAISRTITRFKRGTSCGGTRRRTASSGTRTSSHS